jgi:hypothetical protein
MPIRKNPEPAERFPPRAASRATGAFLTSLLSEVMLGRMAHGGLAGELLFAVRRGYHEASGNVAFGGPRRRPPE